MSFSIKKALGAGLAALNPAAALGGAIGYAGYKYRNDAHKSRRGLIDEAYANAGERLASKQGYARQGNEESLVARGMLGGGDATNTVGGQSRVNIEHEFGLEKKDLDFNYQRALDEENAGFTNQLIGDAASVIKLGTTVAGMPSVQASPISAAMSSASSRAAPDVDALAGSKAPDVSQLPSSGGMSPIRAAMTGVEHPSSWFGGIIGVGQNGTGPLDAPKSSWNRSPGTAIGDGQPNYDFNASG